MKELFCGFADGIITPVLNGTFLDGYGFRTTPAVSIRDELHAKVMAVGDGEDTALVFSIDLLGLTPPVYRLVARQITAVTGVPTEKIALNYIHTHAAPASGCLAEMPVSYDYFASVGDLCGEIALRAMERRAPGTFRTAVLPEKLTQICNRRGRDVMDPQIRAAVFRDHTGRVRGVLCSACCHAVINTSMAVSADWLSVLNRSSSDDVPLLYLQGRAGDINPIMDPAKSIDEQIETLGAELAGPVLRFAGEDAPGEKVAGEMVCRYENVKIPMKPFGDAETLKASVRKAERDYFAAAPEDRHALLRELQWRRWTLDRTEKGEDGDLVVPLQYLILGKNLAFAFVPFELLTLAGNEIERLFADQGWTPDRIFVCGYSNSVNGYLASKEEFAFGGYEIAGAAHWYNIAETTEESAETVIGWYRKNLSQGI